MTDNFGRNIKYLRLSVTDLCCLRCIYCMPECGVFHKEHGDILSVDEITEIAQTAAKLGITKIRITGGEPLVRRGIVDICRNVAAAHGITDVAMTTNAVGLKKFAQPLRDAGLTRLNISLDTLKPSRFRQIARRDGLQDVFDGITAAADAGFTNTKINCVLMGGINDDEIRDFVELTRDTDMQVRFIELMPVGECADWDKSRFIKNDEVLKRVPELEPVGTGGVAQLYKIPGYKGNVGLISPMSHKFCSECDRIRVTADGKLKPCLHSAEEIVLKGAHGDELYEIMKSAIMSKPIMHHMTERGHSDSQRGMSRIGG